MPMTPDEIRKALRQRDVRQVEIARAVKKSKQLVGDVINGHRDNADIKREVAARIGKPVSRVFGAAACRIPRTSAMASVVANGLVA